MFFVKLCDRWGATPWISIKAIFEPPNCLGPNRFCPKYAFPKIASSSLDLRQPEVGSKFPGGKGCNKNDFPVEGWFKDRLAKIGGVNVWSMENLVGCMMIEYRIYPASFRWKIRADEATRNLGFQSLEAQVFISRQIWITELPKTLPSSEKNISLNDWKKGEPHVEEYCGRCNPPV